jgi:hypothetical protein
MSDFKNLCQANFLDEATWGPHLIFREILLSFVAFERSV